MGARIEADGTSRFDEVPAGPALFQYGPLDYVYTARDTLAPCELWLENG